MNPIKVRELNNYIRKNISTDYFLMDLDVEGEVSDLRVHKSSGHIYLTLKDDKSRIKVFYRDGIKDVLFDLQDGQKVIVTGYVDFFEKTGDAVFNADKISLYGQGALYEKFLQLKAKLDSEGLFDADNKKKIKEFPKSIALISAQGSAAIKDTINVIKRRNNIPDILIFNSLMQGVKAADEVSNQIIRINKLKCADVIIIARGGGSYEDLYAFNDEKLARTIYSSEIPVISGIGHDIDFTIADFVADLRAATPTAAGELVCKPKSSLHQELYEMAKTAKKSIESQYTIEKTRAEFLQGALKRLSPVANSLDFLKSLQDLISRMRLSLDSKFYARVNDLKLMKNSLYLNSFKKKISSMKDDLNNLKNRNMRVLNFSINSRLIDNKNMLKHLELSYKSSMKRQSYEILSLRYRLEKFNKKIGYPRIMRKGFPVFSIDDLSKDDLVSLVFKDGACKALILDFEEK